MCFSEKLPDIAGMYGGFTEIKKKILNYVSYDHFPIKFYKHFFLIAAWVGLKAPSCKARVTPIKLIDLDHFGIIFTTEYFFELSTY